MAMFIFNGGNTITAANYRLHPAIASATYTMHGARPYLCMAGAKGPFTSHFLTCTKLSVMLNAKYMCSRRIKTIHERKKRC